MELGSFTPSKTAGKTRKNQSSQSLASLVAIARPDLNKAQIAEYLRANGHDAPDDGGFVGVVANAVRAFWGDHLLPTVTGEPLSVYSNGNVTRYRLTVVPNVVPADAPKK